MREKKNHRVESMQGQIECLQKNIFTKERLDEQIEDEKMDVDDTRWRKI